MRLNKIFLILWCVLTLNVNALAAFPTTGILDNFNRSNETPITGWTTFRLYSANMQIISNKAAAGATYSNGYWNATTYQDTEAYFTIPTKLNTNNYYMFAYGRIQGTLPNSPDGYGVGYKCNTGGNDTMVIGRFDDDTFTVLGATITQEITDGDSMGLEIISSIIKAYYKSGAGSWGDVSGGGRSDSTYGNAGYVGINIDDTTGRVDGFGGGTVVVVARRIIFIQ